MRGGKVALRDKKTCICVRIYPILRELYDKLTLVSYKQLLHVEQVIPSRHTHSDYIFCCKFREF